MNLYTPVEVVSSMPLLSQENNLLLMGSCFASEMGQRLADAKFRCDVNPYGVLYNPFSISAALRDHGSFSSVSAEETLAGINGRLKSAHERLDRLDCLLLTFGSAWVYENKKTGTVVANCHKQPESCFTRRMLSVSEIVSDYTSLLSGLLARIPRLKVLFTVSPIRHVRDGMHANQLSKATLLLAVNQLQATFPEHVFYFPAYELLLDELRDYRFYAEDMVHPSETAIRYVWERFTQSCISADALRIMEESENIRKMLLHKPFYPASEEYKRFLGQIVLKIDQLNGKYPYLDFQKEREICRIRLKA